MAPEEGTLAPLALPLAHGPARGQQRKPFGAPGDPCFSWASVSPSIGEAIPALRLHHREEW